MDSRKKSWTEQETGDQDEEILLDPPASDEEILLDPPAPMQQQREWSAPAEQRRDWSTPVEQGRGQPGPMQQQREWPAPAEVIEQVTLETKYAGYIDRQAAQVERFHRLEAKPIPAHFDGACGNRCHLDCFRHSLPTGWL